MRKEDEGGLRERQRQLRCDTILDAVQDLVREAGWEGLTMDTLAARAGVTKPTLYAHFPNKDALAVAAVVRIIRRGQANIDALDPALTPLERLETVLRWAFTNKYLHRQLPLGGAPTAVIRAHPDYQDAHRALVARLVQIVDDGKAAGEVRAEVDTRTAVQAFIGLMRHDGFEELVQTGAVSGASLVETLTDLMIRSLRRDA